MKFIYSKAVLFALICVLIPTGYALAMSLTLTDDIHSYSPMYIRVLIGNHEGCQQVDSCIEHQYSGSLISENAQIVLTKEFLINSDEVLDNDIHDTGLPTDHITFDFSTEFYKGFIIKLYADENTANSDALILNLSVDGEDDNAIVIPYKFFGDSTSVLATAGRAEEDFADLENYAKMVNISQVFLHSPSESMDKEMEPTRMRYRLEIISRLMSLERYTRAQLLAGNIENLTYLELQRVWERIWNNIQFTGNDVVYFKTRYSRLKKMLNNNETSLARVVGSFNMYMRQITYRNY